MKNILVFDTATTACSVALKTPKGVFSRHEVKANIHSKALLNMVDAVLLDAEITLSDVDVLGVGIGPGSFTGLRIGIGVAQGLAYSNDIEIVAMPTLEMIALNALEQAQEGASICVGHDARMSEIYFSTFQYEKGKRLSVSTEAALLKPGSFSASITPENTNIIFCGNAWQEYQAKFAELDQEFIASKLIEGGDYFPNAERVVSYLEQHLSEFNKVSCLELSPSYVRNDVAKKSTKKK